MNCTWCRYGVEVSVRAALGAVPDSECADLGHAAQDLLVEPVCAGDAFEWNADATTLHFPIKLPEPPVAHGEYIVGKPEHIGTVPLADHLDLVHHPFHAAPPVGIAVD